MFCIVFGLWCGFVVDQRRELCPQPDITAYQLALMLHGTRDIDLLRKYPELTRHTSEPGKCRLS